MKHCHQCNSIYSVNCNKVVVVVPIIVVVVEVLLLVIKVKVIIIVVVLAVVVGLTIKAVEIVALVEDEIVLKAVRVP